MTGHVDRTRPGRAEPEGGPVVEPRPGRAARLGGVLYLVTFASSIPAVLLLAPVLESMLWPVASVLLLMPQRRAPNPDRNRPL